MKELSRVKLNWRRMYDTETEYYTKLPSKYVFNLIIEEMAFNSTLKLFNNWKQRGANKNG
jgi:hypothetical protein